VADSQLSVQVVVDANQINGVLEPAAAAAKDAFNDLAAAQIRVKSPSYELNSTLNTLAKGGLAPTAEQTEEVAAAMFEAEQAAHAFAAAEDAAYGSTEKLTVGANNARAAFMGLNRELGLGGNRALSTFISQSSTLGPILSQAFTGIAIAGFIQLAVLAGEKLAALIDDTFIFTAAQKALYAQELGANQAIDLANKQHVQALRELAAIGLAPIEQAKLRAQYAKEDAEGLAGQIGPLQTSLEIEEQKLNVMQQQVGAKKINYAAPLSPETAKLVAQLKEQEATVKRLNAELGVLQAQSKAAGDAVAIAQKQIATDAVKQQTEDLKNYNREIEREGKEAEEAAIRRGEAERRAADEREKLDEEIERETQDGAKRDLEAFRSTLAEKNRLVAEQGKNELAQIRANADLAEKSTAQKSLIGGASPAISQEALTAARQEVGVIQELIAAEDELREKLLATGAAQDDARIEESLRRQAALTQQMSKAWDDYAKKVEQVTVAQTNIVKQQTSSLFSSLNSNLVSMVNGQETVLRGLQKIWTSFVDGLILDFAKMGEKWITEHVIMAAVSKLFHLQDATSAATSAAAAVAAAKTAAAAQVGLAGAGGVASMAAAPFPIDTTAPAFGASMAAAAASLAPFEEGGMVPGYGPVPILAHGGEMVLNRDQQRALGGGGHTFNFNHYGPGTNEQVRSSSKEFVKVLSRELRRRNLGTGTGGGTRG
jgi:hypothetical protein